MSNKVRGEVEEFFIDELWLSEHDAAKQASNFLASLEAAGFTIVPKEPTTPMMIAGSEHDENSRGVMLKVWNAMLEAAKLCSDCPPVRYPTDKTRCKQCPLHSYFEPTMCKPGKLTWCDAECTRQLCSKSHDRREAIAEIDGGENP